MPRIHRIHPLPKSHSNPVTWARLISAQKVFRLQALQTSPESFSSTYAREVVFTDGEWEARLQNPLALTLVAVKCSTAEDGETEQGRGTFQACAEGDWQGSAVLFGPSLDPERSNLPVFEIFGLFVLPSARGHGIGTSLVEVAIDQAGGVAGYREVAVRVRAAAGNAQVVGLYEKLGFRVVQETTESGEIVLEWRREQKALG
jgi:GNAT superfamily N-acetyltransferase